MAGAGQWYLQHRRLQNATCWRIVAVGQREVWSTVSRTEPAAGVGRARTLRRVAACSERC